MIYLVLGMHKSGTTMVSQLMQDSGIDMGVVDRGDISYDEGEKFEDPWASLITKAVLRVPWRHNSLEIPDTGKIEADERLRVVAQRYVLDRSQGAQDWGFKEPRASLVYDFWREMLPEHKVVFVLRRPEEIWVRYMRRFPWYRPYKRIRRGVMALRAWCFYNERLLGSLERDNADYTLLLFSRLVGEETEFKRLESFLGRELKDSRKTDLYRNRTMKTSRVFAYRLHKCVLMAITSFSVDRTWNRLTKNRLEKEVNS